jgi:hydroxymethylbilane synthase
MTVVRLGTRGSALAIVQAELAVAALAARGIESTVVPVVTTGDRRRAAPDKEKWVKELELALLADEVDLAVHSAKDVPGALPEDLELVGALPRADAHDALCGAASLTALPEGARVGTSSLRRRAQVLAARPDVEVVEVRGNVDTRLRSLADGEVDALVLAAAGLRRLGRSEGRALTGELFVPAPGQGCLALQGRIGETRAAAVDDPAAHAALDAERAAVRVLEADCHTPVGIHADGRSVRGFVGRPDGSAWVLDEVEGLDGEALAHRMLAAGAREILA